MKDLLAADTLEIGNCGSDCDCQSIHLVMNDAGGDGFAAASMQPETARRVAADLLKCADLAEAQQLKNHGRIT